jgi:hypothetical protein
MAFDYLTGHYYLEISRRLRENEFVGGKIKLGKLGTSLTGPGQGSIEDANNFVCESEK